MANDLLKRPQINRYVQTQEAADRLTARYKLGAEDRMVKAAVKRIRRAKRNLGGD